MMTMSKRSLSGIRMFLLQQNVDVPAHADEEQVLGALYQFLVEHRADAPLWKSLTQSIRDTGCLSVRVIPKSKSSISFRQAVGDLSKLRASLPELSSDSLAGFEKFKKFLNAGVLAMFLGAGFAASGCSESDNHTNAGDALTNETDPVAECTPVAEIADNQIDDDCDGIVDCDALAESTVCDASDDLESVAVNACVTLDAKEELCGCFADLTDDWKAGLTDIFANGTADEIADVLDQMVICCTYEDLSADGLPFDASTPDKLKAGTLCEEQVPVYMAVPFNR
jgi:hypothetical protein